MFSILLNGQLCKEQTRILEEQRKFYEELYTSDPHVHFDLINDTDFKLCENDKK